MQINIFTEFALERMIHGREFRVFVNVL